MRSSALSSPLSLEQLCPPPPHIHLASPWRTRGVPKPLDPPVDPVAALRAIYLRAADLHAAFWCDPLLLKPKNSWLRAASWYR